MTLSRATVTHQPSLLKEHTHATQSKPNGHTTLETILVEAQFKKAALHHAGYASALRALLSFTCPIPDLMTEACHWQAFEQ